MTASDRRRYRLVFIWFVLALVLLQALGGALMLTQQQRILVGRAETAAERELNLLENLIREPLLKDDYATVVQFMAEWTRRDPDVALLRAVAPNGFVLAQFGKPGQTAPPISMTRELANRGQPLLVLTFERRLTALQEQLYLLRTQLLWGGAIFTLVLGTSLWLVLERLGLRPLKREIERRGQVETALRQHRNRLNDQVSERTRDLSEANERLSAEVASRKAKERQLVQVANYDNLTGLANRRLLTRQIERAIARARRYHGGSVAIIYLDLDRFKDINDSLGHAAGDQLLIRTGRRLRECVRSTDTVARFGGDEFVVLLEQLGGEGDIVRVAQHLLEAIRCPVTLRETEVYTSASLGIAIYPDNGEDTDQLIRNADAAMYSAKGEGGGTFHFFTDEFNRRAVNRVEIARGLRRALDEGNFELRYQPQVELATGRLLGFEALLRWRDPDHGIILPNAFIPFAEESALIGDIGGWVLKQAACDAVGLRQMGGDLRLAINISGRQFRSGRLTAQLADALSACTLPADAVELEITETQLMEDWRRSQIVLKEIKETGVRVAVDDFGTGYSSLAYLKRFPIDTLKIDRSFVRDVPDSVDDTAIVKAVISMAESLGYEVVAEGVEKRAQALFLLAHGCRVGQGHLFGRPMPLEKARARVTEQNRTGQVTGL